MDNYSLLCYEYKNKRYYIRKNTFYDKVENAMNSAYLYFDSRKNYSGDVISVWDPNLINNEKLLSLMNVPENIRKDIVWISETGDKLCLILWENKSF